LTVLGFLVVFVLVREAQQPLTAPSQWNQHHPFLNSLSQISISTLSFLCSCKMWLPLPTVKKARPHGALTKVTQTTRYHDDSMRNDCL
jgi:hypothetical protein